MYLLRWIQASSMKNVSSGPRIRSYTGHKNQLLNAFFSCSRLLQLFEPALFYMTADVSFSRCYNLPNCPAALVVAGFLLSDNEVGVFTWLDLVAVRWVLRLLSERF
jgi:hypothetical protein